MHHRSLGAAATRRGVAQDRASEPEAQARGRLLRSPSALGRVPVQKGYGGIAPRWCTRNQTARTQDRTGRSAAVRVHRHHGQGPYGLSGASRDDDGRTAGSNGDVAGREVEHFFATYKRLEGVATEVEGWARAHEATAEVEASVERI